MRKTCWMLLVGIALWLPLAAAQPSMADVRIKGRIQIGPDGSVVDYRLSHDVPAPVEEVLQSTVRAWRFEPVLVDGRAVIAETGILLMLDAWPKAGGLALRIRDVAFGAHEGEGSLRPPPRYPPDALRSGVQGRVVLLLRLDAEGDVLEAAVEQTSISAHVPARQARAYAGLFEAASLNAALRWRFGMRESVDGVPVGGTVRTPVEFRTGGSVARLRDGEVRPAPWHEARGPASADELAALAAGGARALDSVFRLLDPVVGVELATAAPAPGAGS